MCSIDHEKSSDSSNDTFPSYEKWSDFKSNKHRHRKSLSEWNIDTSIGEIDDTIITHIQPTNKNSEMLLLSLLDMFIDVYSKENNIEKIRVKERMVKLLHNYGCLQHIYGTDYSLDKYKKFLRMFLRSIFSVSPDKLLSIEYSNLNESTTNNIVLSRYQHEFEEIEQIGKGGYGSIFKSKHCLDNTIYAIKKIKLKNTNEIGYILREIQILAKLDHINVVRYYNSWIELYEEEKNISDNDSDETCSEESSIFSSNESISSNNQLIQYLPAISGLNKNNEYMLYMQMQLYDYSLQLWLEDRNNDKKLIDLINTDKDELILFRNKGLNIFKQIINGIEHIHSLGIIHRDLKPSNIFLWDVLKEHNDYFVKIGDFGLATHGITTHKHRNGIGTVIYSSPEQINSHQYDTRTDIYSLGLILFEILFPMKTYMEKITNFQILKNGKIPNDAKYYISDHLKNILLSMLIKNQNDRITLTEIKQLI